MVSALLPPKFQHILLSCSFLTLALSQSSTPAIDRLPKGHQKTGLIFSTEPSIVRSLEMGEYIYHDDQPVPENFDARQKWPQCQSINTTAYQGSCSSCWAIEVAAILTDRLCIASNGTDLFEYSSEDLLTCCSSCTPNRDTNHCLQGGNPFKAIQYVREYGVVSGGGVDSRKGCKPVSRQTINEGNTSACERKCTNENYAIPYEKDKKYCQGLKRLHKKKYQRLSSKELKQVQIEIMTNGPVLIFIETSHDFEMYYRADPDDIFQNRTTGPYLQKHILKLIGWGTGNGTPYWLAANTWGTDWGQRGFVKIERGVDLLRMERVILAADIEVNRPSSSPKRFQIWIHFVLFFIVTYSNNFRL